MNLLVDTNIVVDILRKREGCDYSASRLLLALGRLHEFELWISPSQLGDLLYVLTGGGKKRLANAVAREVSSILEFVRVCSFGQAEADAALKDGWPDLEDTLIHQAARSIRASAIITRNQTDFKNSSIPALSSSEFFEWYAESEGVRFADILLDD